MSFQVSKTMTAAIALLAMVSLSSATPHRHGAHVRRNNEERDISYFTVTDIVTETVDVTTTIWVDDEPTSTAQVVVTTPTVAAVETTTAESYPQSTTFATSVSVAAPAYSPKTESSIAAATPTTSSTTSFSSATSAVQYAAATATAAGAATSTSDTYTGDITFYDTEGTSACGDSNIDGYSFDGIALPYEFMGTASNDNPYCGKTITIKNGDKTATGTVIDKCMGCTGMSIDLSRHLFDQLADESVGRVSGVEWWFS